MTINDEITELIYQKLSEIDDILSDIINNIKDDNLSYDEIINNLEGLRKKVW